MNIGASTPPLVPDPSDNDQINVLTTKMPTTSPRLIAAEGVLGRVDEDGRHDREAGGHDARHHAEQIRRHVQVDRSGGEEDRAMPEQRPADNGRDAHRGRHRHQRSRPPL